jgi:RNA polymerase sigma factor (sigma-70 family)
MDKSDTQLIADYANGSPDALSALIRRYVDIVYAAAVRLTGEPGMADDVTQAVFILLARKAKSLRSHTIIAGWLVVVTRQVARTAIRGRSRRHHHERAAARSEVAPMTPGDSESDELSRILDQALARLRSEERDAIVLRYLQALSLADVGRALGISEEAARKRVIRGIQRLKGIFIRRGSVLLSTTLSVKLQMFAAPPAPSAVVAAATSSTPTPQAISLSKGTLQMLSIQKSAVISVMVCLIFVAAIAVLAQSNNTAPPAKPVAQPPSVPAVTPVVDIKSLALQLAVTDVNQNIAFFDKIGFTKVWSDSPDPDGKLPRASVRCGNVSIRLYHVANPPHPTNDQCAYFYVDGGEPALKLLRTTIADQGVNVGTIGVSGATLKQFDVMTPDGYALGFYSQP